VSMGCACSRTLALARAQILMNGNEKRRREETERAAAERRQKDDALPSSCYRPCWGSAASILQPPAALTVGPTVGLPAPRRTMWRGKHHDAHRGKGEPTASQQIARQAESFF